MHGYVSHYWAVLLGSYDAKNIEYPICDLFVALMKNMGEVPSEIVEGEDQEEAASESRARNETARSQVVRCHGFSQSSDNVW